MMDIIVTVPSNVSLGEYAVKLRTINTLFLAAS